jgi:hypothetical protein
MAGSIPRVPTIAEIRAEIMRRNLAEIQRLRAITSPYDLLVELQAGDIFPGRPSPAAIARARAAVYSRFVELAAPYPEADRDMLVRVAAKVFGVRPCTLRNDLAAARAAAAAAGETTREAGA